MSQYAGFQVGAFVGPLTASTANSLTQDADPAIYYTLDYLKTMLSLYLGDRFDAEMTRVGMAQYVGKISSTALPFDPVPFLQSSGVKPPFLALFPQHDRPEERTRHWYQLVETWMLLWVLPAMDAAQFAQLYSLLRAAGKIIEDRIENTLDPSWQSGTPFGDLGGIAEIRLDEVGYGSIERVETNLFFPTLSAVFTVKERRMATPNLENLAGVDVKIAVKDADGQEDLIETELS